MTENLKRLLVGVIALAFCVSAIATAQEKRPTVVAFGSDSLDRGTVRVGYWNTEKNVGAGGFFIDYGKPAWKKDYDDTAKFDAITKGRTWRMGSEYWTVLDTNVPLKISGKDVPAGIWYLGLRRSEDGSAWSLVFIDPAKVRSARLDPSQIEAAPVEFKAPVTLETAQQSVERLTLTLTVPKASLTESTLKIAWGKLQLSAPIQVAL